MSKTKPDTIIFETNDTGYPVTVRQAADRTFSVQYGKQLKTNLSYEEAAQELGYCIFHGLACESKIED